MTLPKSGERLHYPAIARCCPFFILIQGRDCPRAANTGAGGLRDLVAVPVASTEFDLAVGGLVGARPIGGEAGLLRMSREGATKRGHRGGAGLPVAFKGEVLGVDGCEPDRHESPSSFQEKRR